MLIHPLAPFIVVDGKDGFLALLVGKRRQEVLGGLTNGFG
jgi:hypothetical protein